MFEAAFKAFQKRVRVFLVSNAGRALEYAQLVDKVDDALSKSGLLPRDHDQGSMGDNMYRMLKHTRCIVSTGVFFRPKKHARNINCHEKGMQHKDCFQEV